MLFMDKIKQPNPQTESTLQALKSSNLPLLLWGCGEMAERAYDFLNEKQIKISNVFVNLDKKDVPITFRNSCVLDLNEVCDKYSSFNVLVGNAFGYLAIDSLKKEAVNINEIYIIDTCELVLHERINYNYILNNKEKFEWTYNELSDDLSKNSFVTYLNAKVDNPTSEFLSCVRKKPYFCEDIINLSQQEIFVDCGAFDGDTINSLFAELKQLQSVAPPAQHYSHSPTIYAFEPDSSTFIKLLERTKDYDNIHYYNKGVWCEKTTLNFNQDGTPGSAISADGAIKIEVDTIDNILSLDEEQNNLAKPMFIKMDIEGAELNALKGAKETILRHKPKLAVCAYHKSEDLIALPQYIKSIVPEYKFYFRLHNYTITEAVLYAVCE